MAVARKTSQTKPDRVLEAAVEYFAGRSHDAWRKALLRTNPEQKGQPRMRLRGGKMVDINQPWAKLDPAAKEDNKRAARDAFDAVAKFPNDREAASDYVHKRWIARNKHDKSLDKALFTPYAKLSEVEKDKDRAHVDRMKQAIAAVRKGAKVKAPAKTRPSAYKSVRIDAKNWARLEAAAGKLTKLTGQSVAPEALLMAGLEAIVAVTGAVSGKPKAKKR
jgi:macrodomain Ter protein organizer (MatP/YcbG family)